MAAPPDLPLTDAKRAARAAALVVRDTCDPVLGAQLSARVLAECPPPPGAVVSGFWPLPGEIDIRPLLEGLHARGHAVVLPSTPPRGQKLRFHRWHPGMELQRERFGTLCATGEEMVPQWLFVPLLAFDRAGRRLGYGGGYYDRTLAALPASVAIGCAFAAQEVAEVPAGQGDVRLNAIATERGVLCVAPLADTAGDAGRLPG